jgi:hypothetical protein
MLQKAVIGKVCETQKESPSIYKHCVKSPRGTLSGSMLGTYLKADRREEFPMTDTSKYGDFIREKGPDFVEKVGAVVDEAAEQTIAAVEYLKDKSAVTRESIARKFAQKARKAAERAEKMAEEARVRAEAAAEAAKQAAAEADEAEEAVTIAVEADKAEAETQKKGEVDDSSETTDEPA